jgi:hypothetical protein
LNESKFCKDVAELHPRILATGLSADGILLASYFKELVYKPKPERLIMMLMQAQLMVSIPDVNKDFFGKVQYTMVSHDQLHIFVFPLDKLQCEQGADFPILVMVVMPPYDHNDLIQKTLRHLQKTKLCSN